MQVLSEGLPSARPELGTLVADLQSMGAFVPGTANMRRGGAGPADGCYIWIGGRAISVPLRSFRGADTPFEIRPTGDGTYVFREGDPVAPVSLIKRPGFYDLTLPNGLPYWKIALLHGSDCLASTVFQSCIHWGTDRACSFCGIGLSLEKGLTIARKSPEALAKVAKDAMNTGGIRHVVLTTGTLRNRRLEIEHLARCVKEIKAQTSLPVHVQCEPPKDLCLLEPLKEAGADTIGLHVESFDERVLREVAPSKSSIGLRGFESAWMRAVELFGPNQVSSFLILGLGETLDSVLKGVITMADMGVFPYVLPLRPIPGSTLGTASPPPPGYCVEVYRMTAEVLSRAGLSSRNSIAGCVKCGACSGLMDFEIPSKEFQCHRARDKNELREALNIRHQVFVMEQGLFEGTDRDQLDEKAIHLVVKRQGEIVGTVRLYKGKEGNDIWYGGRLAVKHGFRKNGVGELLVRHAVECAKAVMARRFVAHIQVQNVRFFQALGWKEEGDPFLYHGRLHQLMEAPLEEE